MKKSVSPAPPRVPRDTPPAATSRVAGTLLFDAGLTNRIRSLLDLFDTRSEAAQVAERSTDALQNWIAGKSAPTFEAMAKLAFAKGVSLQWLATGLGDMLTGADVLLTTYSELPFDLRQRVDQAVELVARAHRQRQSDVERILVLTLEPPA